ncbi:BQ5605_C011g06591 [Microbotryum silenes-dioicae]|uniref:BQ5605_C011g06591 protein n=1 Tax=Microbotryum silenes-dioicae TaxID=796604 RepID=A0A2X0LSU1_9BASI|nr:BQ5605_C011g06591 [Microbotryum silenes-dioicae]
MASTSTAKPTKKENPALALLAVLKTEAQFAQKLKDGSKASFKSPPRPFPNHVNHHDLSSIPHPPLQQPPGIIGIAKNTYARHGIRGFYSGVGALVAGNSLKAGVRFFSYDKFKKMLIDREGKLSGSRSLLAGLGAGMCEAVFAVTPSETIKTKLIDDQKRAQPRYTGLIQGTMAIVREEGIGGIYRALGPVVRHRNRRSVSVCPHSLILSLPQAARQGANSAVRFTSFSTLKSFVSGNARPAETLPAGITFGIGAVAGVITVYTTMPLDVIKTRMQSLSARTEYRNSFHCAARIFAEEGLFRFWKGATPRLMRLVLSGGIVFTVYDQLMNLMGAGGV